MDYKSTNTPDNYCCSKCSLKNHKLWRLYSTFLEHQQLFCADCAEKEEGKPKGTYNRGDGDQIGWLIPAVPTEDEQTFWGYTSVPEAGVEWWYNLPTRLFHSYS